MIFNIYLTKYLIAKGIKNKTILLSNVIILIITYSILYRFFYLEFGYTSIRIAIAIMGLLFFVLTLIKVKKIIKRESNI